MEDRWSTLEVLEYFRRHSVSSFSKEIDSAIAEHKALQNKIKIALLHLGSIEGEKTPTEKRVEKSLKG